MNYFAYFMNKCCSLDDERNNIRGKEALITKDSSSVPVWVIPTDEEVMIARDTYEFATK